MGLDYIRALIKCLDVHKILTVRRFRISLLKGKSREAGTMRNGLVK